MPSLRDEQRALQAVILAGDAASPCAPTRDGQGVAVYRFAYRARLAGALRVNYPILATLLGELEFRRIADAYAGAMPSRHYSIRGHGSELWRSLYGARADLARMEWALGSAFDAPDAAPIEAAFLESIPVDEWADLPFAAHPSVAVLSMSWTVEAQWEAVRAESGSAIDEPREHEHALLVWRKNLQSHWRSASVAEGQALLALHASGTLGRACEALDEAGAEAIGGWFAGWVREGMLVARSERRA